MLRNLGKIINFIAVERYFSKSLFIYTQYILNNIYN